MKNPYAEIRKVPLNYQGIESSAYSVQYREENDWKEAGVVGSKYMLLPNSKVKEAADQVANASNIQFEQDKTFFDGRRYIYSLKDTGSGLSLGFSICAIKLSRKELILIPPYGLPCITSLIFLAIPLGNLPASGS